MYNKIKRNLKKGKELESWTVTDDNGQGFYDLSRFGSELSNVPVVNPIGESFGDSLQPGDGVIVGKVNNERFIVKSNNGIELGDVTDVEPTALVYGYWHVFYLGGQSNQCGNIDLYLDNIINSTEIDIENFEFTKEQTYELNTGYEDYRISAIQDNYFILSKYAENTAFYLPNRIMSYDKKNIILININLEINTIKYIDIDDVKFDGLNYWFLLIYNNKLYLTGVDYVQYISNNDVYSRTFYFGKYSLISEEWQDCNNYEVSINHDAITYIDLYYWRYNIKYGSYDYEYGLYTPIISPYILNGIIYVGDIYYTLYYGVNNIIDKLLSNTEGINFNNSLSYHNFRDYSSTLHSFVNNNKINIVIFKRNYVVSTLTDYTNPPYTLNYNETIYSSGSWKQNNKLATQNYCLIIVQIDENGIVNYITSNFDLDMDLTNYKIGKLNIFRDNHPDQLLYNVDGFLLSNYYFYNINQLGGILGCIKWNDKFIFKVLNCCGSYNVILQTKQSLYGGTYYSYNTTLESSTNFTMLE